ncbi:hypothetical protein BH11PSE3_BH11PSE3_33100 [soil metagenome]
MNDSMMIAKIGQTVWGPAWEAAMAEALKQTKSTIADWSAGRTIVPSDAWKLLREATRLHYLKLADLDPQIVQAYDAAVARETAKKTR